MGDLWQALHDELQQWKTPVSFWWRDDDAVANTTALRKLIELQKQNRGIALHLASIPQSLESSLPPLVRKSPNVWVLQHGFSHQNNALEGQRKIELGGSQDVDTLSTNLASGRETLKKQFAERYVDILVPPWNRVNDTAITAIQSLDYMALSGLGLKKESDTQLTRLNVHLDIINWEKRSFVGTEACLEKVLQQLKTRRTEAVHLHEPIGVMTHHLAHDKGCWNFMSEFLQWTTAHPKIKWRQARQALALAAPKNDGQQP